LNRIILYADKKGMMTDKIQRKIFIIGDMIVSGEGEGPLMPTPKRSGLILIGENPVNFDKTIASLMGFDYKNIPLLNNQEMYQGRYAFKNYPSVIISNDALWHKKSIDNIRLFGNLEFEPTKGWEDVLGNPQKLKKLSLIKKQGLPVFIFGAGLNGISVAEYLYNNGVNITAFCDNDVKKHGKKIWNGIVCISPKNIEKKWQCVIATHPKYIDEIKIQLDYIGIHQYTTM